ncbi:MAG: UDP-N-acetylglucosamine diphosphorylase [Oligoflexales bacterium]
MSAVHIPLETLTNLEDLYLHDIYPDNTFDLLGENLLSWIHKILDKFDVPKNGTLLGNIADSATIQGRVYISESATVEPTAMIQGPSFIGPGATVRHGAYIRGGVYMGKNSILGHASEAKGSVLLDRASAAHFAYLGDSILGQHCNLGAGTRLANLRLKKDTVPFFHPKTMQRLPSGLRKFGAILADRAQTGCNSVLSPGTILLQDTGVYPCVHYHGTLQSGWIKK